MKRSTGGSSRGKVAVGALLAVCGLLVGATPAYAADTPQSIKLSWWTTAVNGTISLKVNGTVVGSFDLTQGDPRSNCNDYERSVTLTDPFTLEQLDTKACNIYSATLTSSGTNYLGYIR